MPTPSLPSRSLSSLSLESLYDLLKPITLAPNAPRAKFINWGLSFTCVPLAVFEPETELQCELILELARREGKVVRAVGVGHSPSDIACTSGFMLRTERLSAVLEINTEKRYVVAQAGITLNDLHAQLATHDLAMINVGSISDQTLAGIVTTATHGSGVTYGVMSTHVMALTLLLADGSRVSCSRHERPDLFIASICGLGSTGLILTIQLEVEPAFRLKEVQESVSFDEAIENLDEFVYAAQHVRLWWFPQVDVVRVSSADRTSESPDPAPAHLFDFIVGYHVIQLMLFIGRYFSIVNNWTARLVAGFARRKTVGIDDSYRIFNVDCRYPQHTTEWAIPYENAQACLRELRAYFDTEQSDPNGLRPHFPVEIRFSAADDIWLSPSNAQQTCWIGIVQYKPYGFNIPYRRLFENFETIVERHRGRPHWAKAHRMTPQDLRKLYPNFDDFVRVLKDVDPHGMFSSEYIQRHILGRDVDNRLFKARRSQK